MSPVTAALCRSEPLPVPYEAVLDRLLGVVPGAAGVGHEHGQELADDDHAGQVAAQRLRAQEDADQDRHQDGQQRRADQLRWAAAVQMLTTRP